MAATISPTKVMTAALSQNSTLRWRASRRDITS
jgi:hypothetical protein